MPSGHEIRTALTALKSIAPAGFALGLHLQFTAPAFMLQTYPSDWTQYYESNRLILADPALRWSLSSLGITRWSAIHFADPDNVMERAAQYGLKFGAASSVEVGGLRSLGFFARSDREFTDGELEGLLEGLDRMHRLTDPDEPLDPTIIADLKHLSVLLTHRG